LSNEYEEAMKRCIALLMALSLAGACQPGATTAARAPRAPTSASFSVQALADGDIKIQGCSRTLSRTGSNDTIFAEDGVASGAKGVIRIDGRLIDVALLAASDDEEHSRRNFADANHTTEIVESLTTGERHEESDSVEETGTLAVTYRGATQTIGVAGGVAC
jgi:hypothetical protein